MKDLIRHILKEETEDNLKNLAIEDMTFAMEIAGGFENIIKKTNPTEKEIDEMITCYLDQNLYPDYNWGPDLFDFYKNEVKTYGFVDFYINDDVAYIYWANDKGRTPNSIEFVDEPLIKFMNKTFNKRWIGPFKKWFEKNSDLKVNDIYLATSSDTPENLSLNENSKPKHVKDKETFQYMVDFIIEEMKEICNKQDADNVEDLISFDACDFLQSKTKIEVTSFDYYNERPRILIHIKYLNTRYMDEEPFIGELQWRLKRWIGDNIVQIEDITYS